MEDQLKSKISGWLERIQQDSWEMELLLSGLAIYGLYNFKEYLLEEVFDLSVLENPDLYANNALNNIYVSLFIGVLLVLGVLVGHLFIRTIWVGSIGLRSISGDIDYDSFKYHQIHKNSLKQHTTTFDKFILRLENIASILFAYACILLFMMITFAIFLCIINGFIFGVITILDCRPEELATKYPNIRIILKIIHYSLLILGGIIAFDFLSLGLLKRINQRHFARLFNWLTKYFSWATLFFLWRPLYYNFIDHQFSKRLFLCTIPILVISVLVLECYYHSYTYFPQVAPDQEYSDNEKYITSVFNEAFIHTEYYEDKLSQERKKYWDPPIAIPSMYCEDRHLPIFIKYDYNTEKFIEWIDSSNTISFTTNGIINGMLSTEPEITDVINEKTSVWKASLDSIRKLKDTIEMTARENQISWLEDQIKNEEQAIIRHAFNANNTAITQSFVLYIDDQKTVRDSNIFCDYYVHPTNNARGLLCTAFLDSTITRGKHLLQLEKYIVNKDEDIITIDTSMVSLPFYYVGQ